MKVCGFCEKEFEGNGRSSYCSEECKKEAGLAQARRQYAQKKLKKERAQRGINSKSVREVAKAAAEAGMSYGKYVAKKGW